MMEWTGSKQFNKPRQVVLKDQVISNCMVGLEFNGCMDMKSKRKTSLHVMPYMISSRGRGDPQLSLKWHCKHEKQNDWTFPSISGHQQKLLIEESVVSTPLCPAALECPTLHIRNRSSLLSGIHTRFSWFSQIFRSGSKCKLSGLVIAKSCGWRISMRNGQKKSFWRRGLASPLGTVIAPSRPALVGCHHRDKKSAKIYESPEMCSIVHRKAQSKRGFDISQSEDSQVLSR